MHQEKVRAVQVRETAQTQRAVLLREAGPARGCCSEEARAKEWGMRAEAGQAGKT